METLPLEVLRMICVNLSYEDAANIRFLTRSLSIVAAESLVTRVCFHTSRASLERLETISKHPVFRQTVKVLVYEAALLADVKCRHEYAKHFELDHHGLERPREPPLTSTDRERRLYLRNKSKWTQNIYEKYDVYRSLFDAQRSLLENNALEKILSRCIPRFPKLTIIDVDPIRRCAHVTSRRFVEEFGSDCGSPLSGNFSRISDQFENMLLPNNLIIKSLRKLEINSLSPSFFKTSRRNLLQQAFSHLTDVDIILKLADGDVEVGEHPRDCFHRHLSNGVFREALSSAIGLEFVSVGIESVLPIFINASAVFPATTWTRLKSLGLSTITSTQHDLMAMLKRQPRLTSINLALMQLTQGNWPDTLDQMRDQLRLHSFMPVGFLEDPQDSWPMDLLNVPVYIDSYEEYDLGSAIDLYVTNKSSRFCKFNDNMANPLCEGLGDFEEGDLVRDMYGTLSDLDDMSLDDMSDASLSLASYSDISMPDLEASDASSGHVAC